MIEISNLKKSYKSTEVLKGLGVKVAEGEQCVVRGQSGSGKSTLLHLLAGLDRPDQGDIWVDGANITKLGDGKLAQYRNRVIGVVFQFHYLLSSMTCFDNIILPSRIGQVRLSRIRPFVKEIAKLLGVTHCLDKFPYQISGGEQQRINIVRAISLSPKLILCDEPTGNLDSENSNNVTKILKTLSHELNSTLIVVTHDNEVASQFERVLLMKDGQLLE